MEFLAVSYVQRYFCFIENGYLAGENFSLKSRNTNDLIIYFTKKQPDEHVLPSKNCLTQYTGKLVLRAGPEKCRKKTPGYN